MRPLFRAIALGALVLPATAHAWSPLKAENPDVKKGNALMQEEQYAEALDAYDSAARELPEERAVQLNRGLALLSQELAEPAKEAFAAAADPSAPPAVRADAYYDLGVVHAREGEAASGEQRFDQASTHFREAAEAFKRSLRIQPGNRNAAWNLEYALKRIQEEEQREQEQQEQQQEQQEQEQQQGHEQQEQQRDEDETQSQPLPRSEADRFLDALEQQEQSLPLQRARRRNAGRRPPEKDW